MSFFSIPTLLLSQVTVYGITPGSNGSSSCIIMNPVVLFGVDALTGVCAAATSGLERAFLCGRAECLHSLNKAEG